MAELPLDEDVDRCYTRRIIVVVGEQQMQPSGTNTEERLLYRDHEAAERLGISRAHLRKQIAAGFIKVVKIGNATRITRQELERYVRDLETVA